MAIAHFFEPESPGLTHTLGYSSKQHPDVMAPLTEKNKLKFEKKIVTVVTFSHALSLPPTPARSNLFERNPRSTSGPPEILQLRET